MPLSAKERAVFRAMLEYRSSCSCMARFGALVLRLQKLFWARLCVHVDCFNFPVEGIAGPRLVPKAVPGSNLGRVYPYCSFLSRMMKTRLQRAQNLLFQNTLGI